MYLITMSGYIQFGDETEKYRVAQSIVERGEFSFRPTDQRNVVGTGGRTFSGYELGQTLIEVPFYAFGKLANTVFPVSDPNWMTMLFVGLLNPLATALMVVLFYHTCLQLGIQNKTAVGLTLVLGLSTIVFPYSRGFTREPLLTLFTLLGFYMAIRFRATNANRFLLLAGLVSGFLAFIKLIHALLIPVLLVYLAVWIVQREQDKRSPRQEIFWQTVRGLTIFLLPGIVFIFIQSMYGFMRFGSFSSGLGGVRTDPITWTLMVISEGHPNEAIWGLLFSLDKSFLLYSPPVVLSFVAWIWWFRAQPREAIAILVLVLIEFTAVFLRVDWDGGTWWGPRYLVQITPLVMLPLGFLIDKTSLIQRRMWTGVLVVLAILGFLIQVVGALVSDRDYLDIVGAPSALMGQLDFLSHGVFDSLVVYLIPAGIPVRINPYAIVLIVIVVGLGIWLANWMRAQEFSVPRARAWRGLALVLGIELLAFGVWVVAPYSQVLTARADTKFVAANTFLADGRTCEATKLYGIALSRGTAQAAPAVARIEHVASRPQGIGFSANDLLTDEERSGDAVLSRDAETSISDDGAFKASTAGQQDVIARGLSYSIPAKPNQMYQVSGWVKSENIYGTGYGVVTVFEDNGLWEKSRVTDMVNVDETSGWQFFRKTFTTLPTTRRFIIAAGLWKTFGTVWVDGVQLAETSASNPASPNLASVCPQTGIRKSDLPSH